MKRKSLNKYAHATYSWSAIATISAKAPPDAIFVSLYIYCLFKTKFLYKPFNSNRIICANTGRSMARHETIRKESVPIQLTQCWFPGLAISNAKILIYFLNKNKIYRSNCIKQHSETVTVRKSQNVDCSLEKKLLCH